MAGCFKDELYHEISALFEWLTTHHGYWPVLWTIAGVVSCLAANFEIQKGGFYMEDETKGIIKIVFEVVVFIMLLIVACLVGCPSYNVYSSRMDGEAQLAHAKSSKEVAVAEAKAKMESASMLAQAEIERAKGVAEANRIIGNSLKGNEDYLRYLWIHNLAEAQEKGSQIIYIPTEAGLPVLEAGKRR